MTAPSAAEVEQLRMELKQVATTIMPYDPYNRFKVMTYNCTPPGQSVHIYQNSKLQTNLSTGQSYYIDQALFAEAMSRNPDSTRLYPWQINSCKELEDRTAKDIESANVVFNVITRYDEKLRAVETDTTGKCAERLQEATNMQAAVTERLCIARMKLDILLELKGKTVRDSGLELRVKAKLDELLVRIDRCRRIDRFMGLDLSRQQTSIGELDRTALLQVLREQRKGLQQVKNVLLGDIAKLDKLERGFRQIRP